MAAQCWSTCEEISHVQGQRRSPSKMVGGAKSHLESNPLPARDAQRAQTDLVCTKTQRPHRDWDRTVLECLRWRPAPAVHRCRARGSGCSRPRCGISPLGGGHHQPHHRAARTYTGLGKQTLRGHRQNLVCTRTQEKGAVTPTRDPSGQITGREHSPAHQQKVGLKVYWAWPPPIRTRPSSLPSGSFHKPLILLHQRADRMKTTITEN